VDIEEGGRALLAEKQPSRQFVTVDQLGQLALFLCSAAAAQITGTAIPVDGGWTAQ
jgi:3-hydroxybutyrate dehydrogenase